ATEEPLLLVGTAVGGDALEGVPERGVAAAAEVDREVAFEHAALRAEGVDALVDVGPPFTGELLRRRRRVRQKGREAAEDHGEPAQLDVDVRALGERAHVLAPGLETLFAPPL